MGADQSFCGAWIHSQEVAVAPIALHLLSVILVRGKLEHDLFTEDGDGLQALMPSDIFIARSAVGLNSVATYHFRCP